jgi:hypothetical protein
MDEFGEKFKSVVTNVTNINLDKEYPELNLS